MGSLLRTAGPAPLGSEDERDGAGQKDRYSVRDYEIRTSSVGNILT